MSRIRVHATQNVEHRRLARARRAQNDGQFAFFDAEAHIIVSGDGGGTHLVTLVTMLHFDICHFGLHSTPKNP